jgi:glutamate-1-semialdehyde aminotransferase
LSALEAALAAYEPAAVIIELPGVEPDDGYLQAAVDATHRHGAVFVLDEIVSGFRYARGGAQELYGIEPDLACFGKGMTNGYPLAAVVGSEAAMAPFEEIFFSMTYSGETTSLAAALATLDVIDSEPVLEHIWARGKQLRAGLSELADHVSFGVTLLGSPPRSALAFDDGSGVESPELRALFLQECHRRGVLFGAPIFPTYSHSEADVTRTLAVAEVAFERMEAAYVAGAVAARLEGVPPGVVFRSHA